MRILLAVAAVWAIVYVVPFVVYGSASAVLDLKPPSAPMWRFLTGVAVTKLGTAIAFVAIFVLCRNELRGHWVLYASIWFLMFAASEVGDVLRTGYSVIEAALGIMSEAIYAPASALIVDRMFR